MTPLAQGDPRAVTYRLLMAVAETQVVVVGRLGASTFPAGRYAYTGSARRALEARVRRHLMGARRLHWHIDHLLAAPGVRVLAVERFADAECVVNAATPGRIVVPGFGATDCRAGCGSHLKWLGVYQVSCT